MAGYNERALLKMVQFGGRVAKKSDHTANGSGAQTDNVFSFAGTLKVREIAAKAERVGDSTTLSGVSFTAYDGTNTVELTDTAAALDASGLAVGALIFKNGAAASVAAVLKAGTAVTATAKTTEDIVLNAKAGVTNYIRFNFTGDAATDVDFDIYIVYDKLSDDAVIESV